MKRRTKEDSEVLDYIEDWSDWLGSDTISTSVWSVPSGITEDSESETTTTATIWISGGTNNSNYVVTNTITTAGGRTGVRSFLLSVIRK